jgi:Fic-DOC domain mobile mystery protein B
MRDPLLTVEERAELVVDGIATRAELIEHENAGIMAARRWALGHRREVDRVLAEPFLRELHARMFGSTWKWAGEYRGGHLSYGLPPQEILAAIDRVLIETRHDLAEEYYTQRALCARYHHRIAIIHPFPRGNGRWSRLATDTLALALHEPIPTWGAAGTHPSPRDAYLDAIAQANEGEFEALFRFLWS